MPRQYQGNTNSIPVEAALCQHNAKIRGNPSPECGFRHEFLDDPPHPTSRRKRRPPIDLQLESLGADNPALPKCARSCQGRRPLLQGIVSTGWAANECHDMSPQHVSRAPRVMWIMPAAHLYACNRKPRLVREATGTHVLFRYDAVVLKIRA